MQTNRLALQRGLLILLSESRERLNKHVPEDQVAPASIPKSPGDQIFPCPNPTDHPRYDFPYIVKGNPDRIKDGQLTDSFQASTAPAGFENSNAS